MMKPQAASHELQVVNVETQILPFLKLSISHPLMRLDFTCDLKLETCS